VVKIRKKYVVARLHNVDEVVWVTAWERRKNVDTTSCRGAVGLYSQAWRKCHMISSFGDGFCEYPERVADPRGSWGKLHPPNFCGLLSNGALWCKCAPFWCL